MQKRTIISIFAEQLVQFKNICMVTFHRVGQGLFASESFENHTIIYDCGGEKASLVKEAIDSDITESPEIDILFISHYDRDHVNGIIHLLNTHEVKHVILPLVSDFSRFLSSHSYVDSDFGIIRLLYSNPNQFFKTVSPGTICHFLNSDIMGSAIYTIDNLPDELELNVRICLIGDKLLMPYNRKVMTRQEEAEFLSRLGLDPNLSFDKIKEKWRAISGNIKQKLIEAGTVNRYNINDYSMTLYSQNKESKTLYLGDYNAKKNFDELKNVYSSFWKEISCLQVPHHGSNKSFDEDLLTCGAIDYVISNNRTRKRSKMLTLRKL